MSSAAAAGPDTLVTLKVSLNGNTRRFKLPLRDLEASTLEPKLRTVLALPSECDCLIERYSDSAGAYIVLDSTNNSVYKQLYRAAKAKQKLKLRITTQIRFAENPKGPKAVSVEDEPELPKPAESSPADKTEEPIDPPPPSFVMSQPSVESVLRRHLVPAPHVASCSSIALLTMEQEQMTRNLEKIEASVAALNKKLPLATPVSQSLEALREAHELPNDDDEALFSTAQSSSEPTMFSLPIRGCPSFAVCCNQCDGQIPDAHYHCATCDDGDFDLCQSCVDKGATCRGADHWLIKRFIENGAIVNSTTEIIRPKPKVTTPVKVPVEIEFAPENRNPDLPSYLFSNVRTCNSCVTDLPERFFVHCTVCDDFDLCRSCFIKNQHGHHPKHGFVPAVEDADFELEVTRRLAPGRCEVHNAICDGCDQPIRGVRHKCLDCPDWDYCNNCIVDAGFVHPNHRFVPVYEPLESAGNLRARAHSRAIHVGICCDGPLCNNVRTTSSYIAGDRYKCAVCHDTDFCANCEASPANTHNKTHPLIKFKTPIKRVNVTTTGEHLVSGLRMPIMGDRPRPSRASNTSSRATETTLSNQEIVQTGVLTVADVQPSEPAVPTAAEEPVEPIQRPVSVGDFIAVYKRDTVTDGTVMPPNTVFTQTWFLSNEGTVPWPAGCSVKFVGGDYMGHVDPKHPAGIDELASAFESSVCDFTVEPGQEAQFTVRLRTPHREGKAISYWRLTTMDGMKFGHRLWCDIDVQEAKAEAKEEVKEMKEEVKEEIKTEPKEDVKVELKEIPTIEEPKVERTEPSSSPAKQESQMIFPKLEKESPVSSIYEETKADAPPAYEEEYEDCGDDDEWAEDDSDAGFMTDEEYDILDASDEEYREEQQKRALKK